MKKILYGLLASIVILGTVYAYVDMVGDDVCGNQIIDEVQSPDRKNRAVIFTRDCGATTGHSTQLSIIAAADQLENEAGNTFILSDKGGDGSIFKNGGARIKVDWTGDYNIIVYFDVRTDFTKRMTEIGDIEVTYEQLAE